MFLSLAIGVEVLATLCLRASDGLSRPLPTAAVFAGYGLAFYLLALVLRDLPLGLTYATWAGIGTAALAVIGIAFFDEPAGALRIIALGLVIAGVICLQLSNPGKL